MQAVKTSSSFTKWKPIEWMLLLLFLVAPFYYHNHLGGEGLRLPNNIIIWMVATIIGGYSLYQFASRKMFSAPKYFSYIAAFPVLVLISGFVSGVSTPMDWLFRLLFIWLGLLFFFALFQHRLKQGRVDRLLFIIVMSALIQACVGIWQMLLIPEWIPFWMPGTNQVAGPHGFFQQINNQATYQVTAIIIAIFLISRPYINKGALWKRLAIVLFFGISAYVISLSGSRIGTLSVLTCIPLAIIGRRVHLIKNKQLSTFAALFFIVGVAIGNSGFGQIVDKMKSTNLNARVGIYLVSVDLIKQKPLFGHGLGSFDSVWQYEKANYYQKNPDSKLINGYVTHPHNELLFWLVEGGLISVLGIFILVLGVLLSLKGRNKHRWAIYLAMLLPIALHTQVELPFYISALHWFLILFLLFVVMRSNSTIKKTYLSNIALNTIRISSLVIIMTAAVFFSHTFVASAQIGQIHGPKQNIFEIDMAKSNPYFRKLAISLQMNSLLLTAVDIGSTEGMDEYILWAEKHIVEQPSALLFTYLTLAYQNVGRKDKMCKLLTEAVSLYPDNENFQSGIEFCSK